MIEGNVIIAEDGMILTNGETSSKKVYLGINDDPSNWQEVPEESDEEVDDSEALSILLGGEV